MTEIIPIIVSYDCPKCGIEILSDCRYDENTERFYVNKFCGKHGLDELFVEFFQIITKIHNQKNQYSYDKNKKRSST